MEDDIEYGGNDITGKGKSGVATQEACAVHCRDTLLCTVFTLS